LQGLDDAVILEPLANYLTTQIETADNLVARLKGCGLCSGTDKRMDKEIEHKHLLRL